jgi:hypothetical protein
MEHRNEGWLMNKALEWVRKKASWPVVKRYPGICLEVLRKAKKNPIRISGYRAGI